MRNHFAFAAAGAALALAAPLAAQAVSDNTTFIKAVRERDGRTALGMLDRPGSNVKGARDISTGETPLHIVVRRRDAIWTRAMLERGMEANMVDRTGDTPLGLAARLGFLEGVKLFLDHGVNVNGANGRGETPLILAVQARHLPIVQLLMRLGANADKTDSVAGYSARDYARQDRRSMDILRALDTKPLPKR